ncbi:MAG: hypothetical protein JXB48_00725 [Candidatus Latescibacteria bacterium]|nr:hypothetical protein [Candidatus Latescibacterota bacterium]
MGKKTLLLTVMLFMTGFNVSSQAQSIYELRKLTEQDWLAMSTEERLNALSTATKHAENQTYMGNFGKYYDMYKRWGYNFYEMEDRYENFAFRGFENYNIIEERRNRWSYNDFGDRIARMRHTATVWRETYSGDKTFSAESPDNYINSIAQGQVDGVWVARESTDDWAVSVIGAGALRAKYTPLTLSIPNINGMRIDWQSANSTVSVFNSNALVNESMLVRQGGVLFRGGHFRRRLGALTLGATYVNQYGVQGNREGGDSWYGTVSNYAPTPMIYAVRFLDDSPNDNEGGPVVYNVRLKVNNKYRDDIIPDVIMDDSTRDRTTAITKVTEQVYIDPLSTAGNGKPDFDTLRLFESLPKYADYFYYSDYKKGANLKNVKDNFDINLANQYYTLLDPKSNRLEVSGTQSLVYLFDITSIREHVNRVEVEITVANDYRIEQSMIFTKEVQGGHDTAGKVATYYDGAYWRTTAQAEGNVKDGSNIKTMTLDFGFQVASIVYGFDANFNYLGFEVNGEFVTNSNHYMYADDLPGTGEPENIVSGQPPRTGHKWAEVDHAYYVTAKKEWAKFGFAGEVFKMGKFYRPWLDYYIPGKVASSSGGQSQLNSRNNTIRLPLIEDNDDDDVYPDTMPVNRTISATNLYSHEDPDGVFPGNDEDNDGIADNNKNNNDIADYDEAFLMFDVDRDEFIFGNDYNNNNIPDFREDDMKYDTPYDLDRKGYHFYVRYTPLRSVNLIVGSMRTKGVGEDNLTNDDYFKFNLNYDVFDVGKLYAEYRYERIKDNVQDPYIQVSTKFRTDYLIPGITSTIGRFKRDLFYDELEYKNSKVNRFWVESKIRAIPSITMENHVKLERNDQVEGVMYDRTYQPEETINTFAMVNKIVYTKEFGHFVFSPGIKFRFYKKDRDGVSRPGDPSDYYTARIPLFLIKYIISSQTHFTLGMQGIPGLEYKYVDFVQNENDFEQLTYTLQVENRTNYFGYNIWSASGVQYDDQNYMDTTRAFESYKSSTLFVKILLGW